MVKNNKNQLPTTVHAITGLNIAGVLVLSSLAYAGTLWSIYAAYGAIFDWQSIQHDIFGAFGEILFIGFVGLEVGLTTVCATVSISLSRGHYRLNNQLLKASVVVEVLIALLLTFRLFTTS
jgi:hypothetical protein